MERFKLFIMMVFMWVFVAVLIIDPLGVEKEYDERGIEVTATITEVVNGVKLRKYYTCTYYNDKGESVTASLTLNQFGGEVGQVVVGRYLPETPNQVYCEASDGMKIGITIFVVILAVLCTVGFFGSKED